MIKINNFNSWYNKENFILKNLNLEVESGCIFGLLGVNGAGKTTLLNSICGIHDLFSGEISIDGVQLTAGDLNFKKKRYFIPDHPVLFEELSAFDYIEFMHNLYEKKLDIDKLNELCDRFSFSKYLNYMISSLSLGNKQKVTIITALLLNTELLILDEPLVGLDVLSIEIFYEEMKKYIKNGNSILFSTHLIEVVNSICDKVAILHEGSIKEIIPVEKDTNIKERFFKVIHYENKCS